MRLCLVEDNAVSALEPLTLTRPVFDLLLGSSSLGHKIARAFGVGPGPARRGVVVRPYLAAVQRSRDPQTTVNDQDWLARGPVLVANGRWVPPTGFEGAKLAEGPPFVGLHDGQPACAWVGPNDAVSLQPGSVDAWFEDLMGRLECREVGGEWIARPWDLVARNAEHLTIDFEVEGRSGVTNRHLASAAIVGPSNRLSIHESARVDPYTVFDTTNGPISIGSGAWVQPFTRVEGPCSIGRDTQLFRANIRGGTTIGPNCRIGGEVEASIVHGYSNKYHEGFLGHAYVGEWVNLGAITSNSDLRNDYGEVHVPIAGDPVATGQAKVGCFVGDHTRTGLGSMLNTGTAIGVMCNVLPAGLLLPKHIPSFTAVMYGRVAPGFSLEQLFATAETVMGRRGKTFAEAERQLYLDLHQQTRLERERAFQKAHDKRGDSWPVLAARR
jgi:UDP-N-acetylglucosamine diphosphorylase / glucose-1-phosphate thymidylyltransferase / UDP-N-acetylgalactosamine diphosphorylase / glucosamine-1-phosphate N-acetyltransferase / galactosamine-1-phosphate N-acetyltransferase